MSCMAVVIAAAWSAKPIVVGAPVLVPVSVRSPSAGGALVTVGGLTTGPSSGDRVRSLQTSNGTIEGEEFVLAALVMVVVAFVITNPDAPEQAVLEEVVIDTCRQSLADFKVPRAVYVVEEFPTGTLDKLLKNKLREIFKDHKLPSA